MARINPWNPIEFTCAIGGGLVFLRNVITKQDKIVAQPNANGFVGSKGPTWYDLNRIIVQSDAKLVLVDVRNNAQWVLINEGINHACAGPNRFSAVTLTRIILNGSAYPIEHFITPKPIVYGPDGSLAYFPWDSQGFYVLHPNGSDREAVSDGPVEDWKIFQYGQYLWRQNGIIWYKEFNVSTNAKNLPGEFGWLNGILIDGHLWVAYHHYGINKVIFHPWNSLEGYVLGDGLCWYLDLTMLDSINGYAVYAKNPNDYLEHQNVVFFNTENKRIDLTTLLSGGPVVIPPVVVKPPVVEPPNHGPIMIPNQIETVKRMLKLHPEIDITDESKRGKIVDYVINALGGKPYGRKARNKDGSNKNTDGLTFLNPDDTFWIADVMVGLDPGTPLNSDRTRYATWDVTGPFKQGENGFWAPGEPIDGSTNPPIDSPPVSHPVEPVVSLDTWIHKEFPQLVAAYKQRHGDNDPNYEWAAFQTYRRYMEPNVWTFDKMLAWELSQ